MPSEHRTSLILPEVFKMAISADNKLDHCRDSNQSSQIMLAIVVAASIAATLAKPKTMGPS